MVSMMILILFGLMGWFEICIAATLPNSCAKWTPWRQVQGNLLTVQDSIDVSNNLVLQIQAGMVPPKASFPCGWLFNVTFVNAQNQPALLPTHPCPITNSSFVKQAAQSQLNCSVSTGVCTDSLTISIPATSIFYCFPLINNADNVPQIIPQLNVVYYDPAMPSPSLAFAPFKLTILLTGNTSAIGSQTFDGISLITVVDVVNSTVNSTMLNFDLNTLLTTFDPALFNNTNVNNITSNTVVLGQSYYFSQILGIDYSGIGIYLALESLNIISTLDSTQTRSLTFQELYRNQQGTLGILVIPADLEVTTSNSFKITVLSSVTSNSILPNSTRRMLSNRFLQSSGNPIPQYFEQSSTVTVIAGQATVNSMKCGLYMAGSVRYVICKWTDDLAFMIIETIIEIVLNLITYLKIRKYLKDKTAWKLIWYLIAIGLTVFTALSAPWWPTIVHFPLLLVYICCINRYKKVSPEHDMESKSQKSHTDAASVSSPNHNALHTQMGLTQLENAKDTSAANFQNTIIPQFTTNDIYGPSEIEVAHDEELNDIYNEEEAPDFGGNAPNLSSGNQKVFR